MPERCYTPAELRRYHPSLASTPQRRVKTTKTEVLREFRENILPAIVQQYGKDDHIAIREAWNNYTDALCKDGVISSHQYDSWTNPF
jgi:hypothetical protein